MSRTVARLLHLAKLRQSAAHQAVLRAERARRDAAAAVAEARAAADALDAGNARRTGVLRSTFTSAPQTVAAVNELWANLRVLADRAAEADAAVTRAEAAHEDRAAALAEARIQLHSAVRKAEKRRRIVASLRTAEAARAERRAEQELEDRRHNPPRAYI